MCNHVNWRSDVLACLDSGDTRLWWLITCLIIVLARYFMSLNDSSDRPLSESARKFVLSQKTKTAGPIWWTNASQMLMSKWNCDSWENASGVSVNVIKCLWHDFLNSINLNIYIDRRKGIIYGRPAVCNHVNWCADVSVCLDSEGSRLWWLVTRFRIVLANFFMGGNDSSERPLSESAKKSGLSIKTKTADPIEG